MPPEFSLLDVREAEFPVLFRRIDAFEEALALLFLGEVQEALDDAGSIVVQVSLQVHDGAIPLAPDLLLIEHGIREPLAA